LLPVSTKTFEDTLRLTRALQNWVSEFITTPHIIQHVWDNARTNFKESITVSALEKNTITVPFHAAAEYLMDDQFVQLFQSRLIDAKDNYVLVEMSYINPPIQLYTILLICR
jgi:tyrosine-protein phosphatase YwqE